MFASDTSDLDFSISLSSITQGKSIAINKSSLNAGNIVSYLIASSTLSPFNPPVALNGDY